MDTYLTFMLGDESFAVPVTNVLEVLQKQVITRVPKTSPQILGIINFRGEIVPVFDMRLKFNQSVENKEQARIMVVFEIKDGDDSTTLVATADAVKDVIEIKHDEIKPVPELGLDYDNRFISGAIPRNDSFILLLNIEKVFTASDTSNKQNVKNLHNTVVTL